MCGCCDSDWRPAEMVHIVLFGDVWSHYVCRGRPTSLFSVERIVIVVKWHLLQIAAELVSVLWSICVLLFSLVSNWPVTAQVAAAPCVARHKSDKLSAMQVVISCFRGSCVCHQHQQPG